MNGTIKYCIVKKYKGLSRKHPKNTHLFFIPIDPHKYMYVALVGKIDEEEGSNNSYIAQLLLKFNEDLFDKIVEGEIEYFGDRFIEVETLKCKSANPSPGKYVITLLKKGFNILSNLEIEYQLEYSTFEKRMYLLKADLNLVTGEVNEKDMKMVAAKQMAFMGGLKRFNEIKQIYQ